MKTFNTAGTCRPNEHYMVDITFLFPNSSSQLSGGLKVVCEYANRLAADGHDVHIAYAGPIFWSKKTCFYKLTCIARYLQTWCKGYSCRNWFTLDQRVEEHWCWSLNNNLRYRIEEAGHKNIQQYKWDKSYALLKQVLFDT